jgi:hypothetical protein
MNVIETLERIFNIEKLVVSERVKILESQFEVIKEYLPKAEVLLDFFSNTPARDTWSISLTALSEDLIIIKNTDSNFMDQYNAFIDLLEEDEVVHISISVDKKIMDNAFSIYCFDCFTKELIGKSINQVMSTFSMLLRESESIVFELFDCNKYLSTSTMVFASSNNIKRINSNFSRLKRLKECRETSYFFNAPEFELIPEDFVIEIDCDDNPFLILFNKISTVLSLAYISSTSSIEGSLFKGQISGQRNVDYIYDLTSINSNIQLLKIYMWIYTDGNAIDKSLLARNIISLHCRYTDLIETDEKTFSSIQSNYKLYLKENATQYINLKNKLAEFICEIVSKIGDHVTLLLNNFKTNLIAIFAFMFSVILVNITSARPLDNIFTTDITTLVQTIIIGSVIYLVICVGEAIYKLKKTKESYKALKNNYTDIFSETEIEELFQHDNLLDNAVKSVNSGICWYSIIWAAFLLVLFIIVSKVGDQTIISAFFNIN